MERPRRWLHHFAVLTAASTCALLFVGGLVTSTGSGLAVPDWPLSFGQLFPAMEGGVLFEHGHRLMAMLVGSLTLGLSIWTVFAEERPGVRLVGILMLFAVVLQGVLGGITVLYKLPLAISVGHAVLAQTFFCLTVALALVTGPAWMRAPRTAPPRHSRLAACAAAATAATAAQLLLGALVRHTGSGLAIPDFPLAFGRVLPPMLSPYVTLHFAHRVGALVVSVAVGLMAGAAARQHRGDPLLLRPAGLAAALVVVQLLLGGLIVWTRRAVLPTTAHLVVGAGVLASCLVVLLRARRAHRRLPAREHAADLRAQVAA